MDKEGRAEKSILHCVVFLLPQSARKAAPENRSAWVVSQQQALCSVTLWAPRAPLPNPRAHPLSAASLGTNGPFPGRYCAAGKRGGEKNESPLNPRPSCSGEAFSNTGGQSRMKSGRPIHTISLQHIV